MNEPPEILDFKTIADYYDERVAGKIRDFTHFNPRIEAAIQALSEWVPKKPKRILEIGCGIGASTWRLARAFPEAEVIGADPSPASIRVANTCFKLPNLAYHEGLITEGVLSGQFDLVVLMDVYEHIALQNRHELHGTIKGLLSQESRVFMSVPTPQLQREGRESFPDAMQPVDEDVSPEDFCKFASETGTDLVYYRVVSVWQRGDYAHAVLARYRRLEILELRGASFVGISGAKQVLKKVVSNSISSRLSHDDYLGKDLSRSKKPNKLDKKWDVSTMQRLKCAELWKQANL
jgi:2-polyprenyl-3-methyl-5-hydroxy-6-metoxy-1,4-benzoquinol methylase